MKKTYVLYVSVTHICLVVHKKSATKFRNSVTWSNINRFSQLFQRILSSTFEVEISLKIPLHIKYIAALMYL